MDTLVQAVETQPEPRHPADPGGVRRWGRRSTLWPAAAFVVVAVLAYRYTLWTFADNLRLDTPLAYLPLLPLFALASAVTTLRRSPLPEPGRRHRELDLLLGVPLLLLALLLITVAPVIWSTYYWSDRPDVLSFALFVIGGLTVLYGARWCWHLRGALAFLLLMWPGLYARALPGFLRSLTTATNSVLVFVLEHVPLGATPSPDRSLVLIDPNGAQPLTVAVGSACAGANGMLGFALLGGGLLLNLRGTGRRKLAWLATGLAMVFAANLLRLASIIALASAGHGSFALGLFHDTIGVLLFAATVVWALLLLPRFGLSLHPRRQHLDATSPPHGPRPARTLRTILPGAMVAVLALLAGTAGGGLRQSAAWTNGTGAPTVRPFGTDAAVPAGWYLQHLENYPWARQYFGTGSSFDRYAVVVDGQTVVAEVVRTPDAGTLATYNLQTCLLFHDYDIETARRIDLGRGVTGLLLDYYNPKSGKRWATVSWAWPVVHQGKTAYERIVLMSEPIRGPATPPAARPAPGFRGPVLSLLNRLVEDEASEDTATYGVANARLAGLAGDLIQLTVEHPSDPGP